MNSVIEHDLTWAYYHMKRHLKHPLREEVGDPHLKPQHIINEMRSGANNRFQFWRDLRPPFEVKKVKRVDDLTDTRHPDGQLYEVTYLCPIDYQSERMWGTDQDGSTFDNKIHGVAEVRIPDRFPERRPMNIVSWGHPELNWVPGPDDELDANAMINPNSWSPLADQLGVRADHPKLAAVREASRKAVSKRPVVVEPLERLLLGPHASLPRLVAVENARAAAAAKQAAEAEARGNTLGLKKKEPKIPKKRQHRIFTAAAGFVQYCG